VTDLGEDAAGAVIGTGEWTYRMVSDWAKLPDGWTLGNVAGVTVDDKDNVYIFCRWNDHPMMVFDREGNFLRSWGEGTFARAHAVSFGWDGAIYCTDDGDHSVRKFDTHGKLLLTIGVPGTPSPRFSGLPFHRCTHTALSPEGDIFVSDGYGNARIHKYSPDGRLLTSWGDFGVGPGEFNIPHNLTADPDGWLYVADRENHRVQVFDRNGRFETEWHSLHRPCAICTQNKQRPLSFIAEAGSGLAINQDFPNLGSRVSVVDHEGRILARVGTGEQGYGPGKFKAPHGIAMDSRLDIYVAELGNMAWDLEHPGEQPPANMCNLKKLVRVAAQA
jgi:hypothetical protein